MQNDNNKIVVVAVAVFISEKVETMTELFQRFLLMQGKTPLSISTCDRPAVREAFEILSMEGQFLGAHLLNPYSVLASNHSRITGATLERIKFIEGVKTIVEERNSDIYKEYVEDLMLETTNRRLLE